MAIDINKEVPVLLADFARRLDKTYRTVYGWCEFGIRHRETGQPVFLETVVLPNGLHTSQEAYDRFIARLNEV